MKPKFNLTKRDIRLSIILILIGLFSGWLIFDRSPGTKNVKQENGQAVIAKKASVWTCSMHPQIKQNKPGKCPICGMTLIPLESNEEDVSSIEIKMSDAAMKIAEVETTIVERKAPYKEVYFPGKIRPDERNISELTSRFPGRIEKLNVNFTGQKVSKGNVLAKIYSPELLTAQKELFEAIKYKGSNPLFYRAARNKLKLWDLTDAQIDKIISIGEPEFYFDVLSPLTGTVTMRHVAVGDYVKEGTPLFEVIDLSHIWVMFDAYESDIPWVKMGDKIDFTIQSLPNKIFTGTVTFIDPVVNPKTRVAYVRTELDNPLDLLKPSMFASGILKTMLPGVEDALVIPKSSILWTGKRAVVYVRVPDKEMTFEFREIVLGEDAGKYYIVKEGLEQGEEIVTNGVFKIDAAAQLQGKKSMMNPEGGAVAMGGHAGMQMGGGPSEKSAKKSKKSQKADMDKKIDIKFKEQLTASYQSYLEMKEAFVASDSKKVKDAAANVKKSLKNVDMKLLKGHTHMMWMEQLEEMNKNLENIGKAGNIAKQREYFSSFNDVFYKSIKRFGISGAKIFYQFCPMALDNKGAYWLSDTKEIRNPYLGKAMLKCGETKEIFR